MSDDEDTPGADPSELPSEAEGFESFVEGSYIEFMLTPYLETLGPLLAVILIAGMFAMLWLWSGDIALPTVVGILLSGLMVTVLPLQFVGLIEDLLIFVIAVALFAVWWSRSGSGGGLGG